MELHEIDQIALMDMNSMFCFQNTACIEHTFREDRSCMESHFEANLDYIHSHFHIVEYGIYLENKKLKYISN